MLRALYVSIRRQHEMNEMRRHARTHASVGRSGQLATVGSWVIWPIVSTAGRSSSPRPNRPKCKSNSATKQSRTKSGFTLPFVDRSSRRPRYHVMTVMMFVTYLFHSSLLQSHGVRVRCCLLCRSSCRFLSRVLVFAGQAWRRIGIGWDGMGYDVSFLNRPV